MRALRNWFPAFLFMVACGQSSSCPSRPGEGCDPRNANCPAGYSCAIAEICTRKCEQTSDCWLDVSTGCRPNCFPGQVLSDGGMCSEESDEGFCPESRLMECIEGYCQFSACASGGCDYDLYGPGTKGTQTQGPE